MKRLLLIGCCAVLVAACGESDEVKSVLKQVLRDPDSAIFDRVLVSKDEKIACAIWTGKNAFGGYAAKEITELKKVDGAWRIQDKQIGVDLCNKDFYEMRDELNALNQKILNNKNAPEDIKQSIRERESLEFEHPELMRGTLEATKEIMKFF